MENSNLIVVLKFRQQLKIFRGLMLHVRRLANMFPHKEKNYDVVSEIAMELETN